MLSRKRGISPLIATVLLIGFVIAIAAMIFIWWGDFVKQKAIKEGLQNDAQRDCMSYVDIDVKSAEITIQGTDNIIKFVINNKGSKKIEGYRFRINGDDGIKTVAIYKETGSVSQEEVSIIMGDGKDQYSGNNPTEAEVIPIILETSEDGNLAYSCTNKMLKVKISSV